MKSFWRKKKSQNDARQQKASMGSSCSVGVAMKGWNEQERKTNMSVGEESGCIFSYN